MKQCSHCKKVKPDNAFSPRSDRPGKLVSWCKDCKNEKQRSPEGRKRDRMARRKWRKRNPEAALIRKLQMTARSFGIHPQQKLVDHYFEKLEEQDECCAICGRHVSDLSKRLHIDHDHETLQLRGLLYNIHNRGLGCFQDDPDLLRKAADYLEKYKNERIE